MGRLGQRRRDVRINDRFFSQLCLAKEPHR
jgi:hypothetical protein